MSPASAYIINGTQDFSGDSRVPIAAKFSEAFYQKFGHAATGELVEYLNTIDATYRAELDRINDLNWARVEARIGQSEARMEQRLAQLEVTMNDRLTRLDAKIEYVGAALQSSIQKSKSETLQWMFGTAAVLLGALIAVIKL